MKAIHINTNGNSIDVVEYSSISDMQRFVGGYIELAYQWPSGDCLYVDEQGMLKPNYCFEFRLRPDQPMFGNGVVVGAEHSDQEVERGLPTNRDPEISLIDLAKLVRFVG